MCCVQIPSGRSNQQHLGSCWKQGCLAATPKSKDNSISDIEHAPLCGVVTNRKEHMCLSPAAGLCAGSSAPSSCTFRQTFMLPAAVASRCTWAARAAYGLWHSSCIVVSLAFRVIADQITAGLRPYANWKDPGREQLVKFEVITQLQNG